MERESESEIKRDYAICVKQQKHVYLLILRLFASPQRTTDENPF